jgi:predicted site-specific integrase-resolvase
MEKEQKKKVYYAKTLAKELGVSHSSVLRWIKQGKVKAKPVKKLELTYWIIPHEEVERLKKLLKN